MVSCSLKQNLLGGSTRNAGNAGNARDAGNARGTRSTHTGNLRQLSAAFGAFGQIKGGLSAALAALVYHFCCCRSEAHNKTSY